MTSSDSATEAVARVEDELGPISGLVNNAGWDEHHLFVDTVENFWRRVVDINYPGVLRTCKAIVPVMIDRERGAIVNIASDAGRVGSSGEAVYSGAKGAVIAFTKSLARETARGRAERELRVPGADGDAPRQGDAGQYPPLGGAARKSSKSKLSIGRSWR